MLRFFLFIFLGFPDENYYKASSPAIKCKDESATFTKAHLNDDFCDCPDGTDEPGLFLLLLLSLYVFRAFTQLPIVAIGHFFFFYFPLKVCLDTCRYLI
jgi:hypothetical protein